MYLKEMEVRIGCSGWSYRGWLNNFYPPGTKPGDYLKLYSRVFNVVEIDSTFYRIPKESMVNSWRNSTPDDFRFTAKLPQEITHERKLINSEEVLERFISVIRGLGSKLEYIVIQFPPSFSSRKGLEPLRSFVSVLPSDLKFAMEFRHRSWFTDNILSLLSDNGITTVWSEIEGLEPNRSLTSDSIYLRLVGDRSIPEDKFGTVQKDRSETIKSWSDEIMARKDEVKHAFVFANNHFQGFGPFTVNVFRQSLGMETVDWNLKMKRIAPDNQRTLF